MNRSKRRGWFIEAFDRDVNGGLGGSKGRARGVYIGFGEGV